jgi:mono/diheme cytochrome c family protein
MKNKFQRKYANLLVVALSLLGMMTAFQNCGKGFQAVNGVPVIESISQGSNSPLILPSLQISGSIPQLSNVKNISLGISLLVDPRASIGLVSCQLDGNPAVNCSSGSFSSTQIADGDHVLLIKGQDSMGQDAPEKQFMFRIDSVAPQVTLSEGPSGVMGTTTAKIVFTATDSLSGVSSRTCALDNNAMAACEETVNLSGLAQGAHSFKIQAKDLAGNSSALMTLNWTVNTSAPILNITAKPNPNSNSTSASFSFSGTAGGMALASYQCKTDNGAFVACTSPLALNGLAQGSHSFSVQGTSSAGVVSSPVTVSWVVDTVTPTVPAITSSVSGFSKLNTASFSFVSTDMGSMIKEYQCSLDAGAYATCTSPRALSALAQSAHTFSVRAVDNAGNMSAAASVNWTVDSTLPVLTLTSQPAASSIDNSATIAFTVTDAGSGLASVECSLDAGAFSSCVSPVNLAGLGLGSHNLAIRATDKAGNQASVAAAWMIIELVLDGKILYANNCAGCHAGLDVSAKLNKTSTEISNAIANNAGGVMGSAALKALTAAQVQAIANVLTKQMTLSKFTCTDATTRGGSESTLRRLTKFEFHNTLKDIYGTDVIAPIESKLSAIPEDVFKKNISEFNPLHSREAVNGIVDVLSAVAESVANNSTYLKRVAPTCLFSGNTILLTVDSCMQTFISNLGLQVYRRPLTSTEISAYLADLKTATTYATTSQEKVAQMMSNMMAAPEMLMHVPGTVTTVGARKKVDAYTVASRLSYRAVGTLPDATLFAAAAANQLQNAAQLKAQATRLLNRAPAQTYNEHAGRRFVRNFFAAYLQTKTALNPDAFYQTYFGVGAVKESLQEEALRFAEALAFERAGKFTDFVGSNLAFPPTADAAKIMGTAVSSGPADAKVVPDGRRGMFMRPIMMMATEPRVSPAHRGAQFLYQFMCSDLGPPPANADEVAAASTVGLDMTKITDRQKITLATNSATCLSCHNSINPPGFVFDSFGPLGEFRTAEKIFDVNKNLANTLPIDTSTNFLIDGKSTPVNGTADFVNLISGSTQVKACLAQHMFRLTRFAQEGAKDYCHLSDVETVIESNLPILEAFATNAGTEDLLWVKTN